MVNIGSSIIKNKNWKLFC